MNVVSELYFMHISSFFLLDVKEEFIGTVNNLQDQYILDFAGDLQDK